MKAPPFADEINDNLVPLNFKLPVLQPYDRRGDPEDHILAFISGLCLYIRFDYMPSLLGLSLGECLKMVLELKT